MENSNNQKRNSWNQYTVIDLEMTGLSVKEDKITEIGAVRVRDGSITETYGMLVNPHQPIPARVSEITGITDEMVKDAMEPDEALSGLLEFIGDDVIVGQNVKFDYSFLKQWAVNHKRPLALYAFDTLKLARKLLPSEQPKSLEALCSYYGIERVHGHRALDDAVQTQKLFAILVDAVQKDASLKERDKAVYLTPELIQYKVKKQTPATKHQIERLKEILTCFHIPDEPAWDTMTRSQASRLIDQYYASYGRPDKKP